MEGMDITPESMMKQIARFRRSAGMTHSELARMLNVPVCFTEILENGILVRGGDGCIEPWNGSLFSRKELTAIASALSNEAWYSGRKRDDEFVFYCPVTVSGSAIEGEMQVITDEKQLFSNLHSQLAGVMGMKMRLYCAQMNMCGRVGAADMVMQGVLAMLNKTMRHSR